jgi:GxxExxY protein
MDEEIERTATATVDAAMEVHRTLGPGLLESIYERCLAYELRQRGLEVRTQVLLPVRYKGTEIDANLRLDLVVNGMVVVEVKAVDVLHPIATAQLITYLRLSGHRLGLLMNFNVPLLRDGLRRIVH